MSVDRSSPERTFQLDASDPTDELFEAMRQSATEQSHDVAHGHARFGHARFGFLQTPNYLDSYLCAARMLVDSSHRTGDFNKVAVACCYLQRHALELALKALLEMFHGVASTPPPPEETKRLTLSHSLKELLGYVRAAHLREAAAGLAYAALPEELTQLVDEISRLENGADERYRYDRVKRKAGNTPRLEVSFDLFDETVLPIGPIQSRLEALLKVLFEGDDSLGGELDIATRLADQERAC